MVEYVTLEEVKHTLELSNLSYADNDIKGAISAASRGIDKYCGRQFFAGSPAETRYFTPTDPRWFDIDDLFQLDSFQSDFDGDGVFESTWVLNRDFVMWPLNAPAWNLPWEEIRVHPRTFFRRLSLYPRSVNVTGTFGWAAVPDEVKTATGIMAERLMKRSRDAPFGVVGIGFDNAAVRIPKVDPDLQFLLEPYVKGGGVMVA